MNDIKDLLISRISDIKVLQQHTIKHSLSHSQEVHSKATQIHLQYFLSESYLESTEDQKSSPKKFQSFSQSCQSEVSCEKNHMNERQSKICALIRKKQKGRIFKEQKIFNSVNLLSFLNDKQIQDFYFNIIDIFTAFDKEFAKYKNPAHFLTISMGQNLKKLFSFFFLKHDEPQKSKQLISQALGREILDLSPAFFLGWVRKWSMNLLNSLLNLNEDKNEPKIDIRVDLKKIQNKILNRNFIFDQYNKKQNNTFNFIPRKSSRQSPNKTVKENKQKKSNSFRSIVQNLILTSQANQVSPDLTLNSKEIVYAYCLDDLKRYYKNLPLEDLDIGYLRNIKKIGKKQDLISNQNIKNAVEVLIECKNSNIKTLMTQFQFEYARFKETNIHFQKKVSTQSKVQNNKISTQENQSQETVKTPDLRKNSLKDLSVKNLKNLFDLNSKLLTPPQNQRQSYKNRIKFSYRKNQQVSCQNLTDQLVKQKSYSDLIEEQRKQSKIINYNNILTQQISEETSQIENKIKLLKRINNKNKELKEKFFGAKKKMSNQDKSSETQVMECFVDEHIEPNQKICKLPKILTKDKNIDNQSECPQDLQISPQKNYFVQKKSRQYQLDENRLNKPSINRQKSFFGQKISQSQQFHALISRKNTVQERPFDSPDLNRRFQSEAAQKQSMENTSIEENERPMSNFSFKSKAFGGSKKSSLNMIKLAKNRISLKNQFGEIQNVEKIHQKIRDKFDLKQNTSQNLTPKASSNIFSNQKPSFQLQSNKDDFIRYLKNLENEKILNQKSKCTPSKQKQKSIKRKFQ